MELLNSSFSLQKVKEFDRCPPVAYIVREVQSFTVSTMTGSLSKDMSLCNNCSNWSPFTSDCEPNVAFQSANC